MNFLNEIKYFLYKKLDFFQIENRIFKFNINKDILENFIFTDNKELDNSKSPFYYFFATLLS